MKKQRFCFIGAGSMTEAMLAGLLNSRHTQPENIAVINRENRERLRQLQARYGVVISIKGSQAIQQADTIIFAVKPVDMETALQQWAGSIHRDQKVLTVAAGISTRFVEAYLNQGTPVIRAMPNTSCAIGSSATALCSGSWAKRSDLEAATKIFLAIGSTVIIDESEMDAVTALSGSGPAYIYYLVEAMEKAGITAGLPQEKARQLTLQTLIGAAQMLQHTKEDPAELRHKIMSPGGTTVAGLKALQEHGFDLAVKDAVLHAKQRSKELENQFSRLPNTNDGEIKNEKGSLSKPIALID